MIYFNAPGKKGVPVYGENDYAFHIIERTCEAWPLRPLFIGITGTDGKSTTTALLAWLLGSQPDIETIACGNYGLPLSREALRILDEGAAAVNKKRRIFVVECSSYQLEPLVFFRPEAALLLNLARDHQDRYENMDAYLGAKLKIIKRQTPENLFISTKDLLKRLGDFYPDFHSGSSGPRTMEVESLAQTTFPEDRQIHFRGTPLLPQEDFPLAGAHNRLNLAFALVTLDFALTRADSLVDREKLAQAIRSFSGLEHRLQYLGQTRGVSFVNDSKATTVQAMLTAIRAYRQDRDYRVLLLCGGRDKASDFSILPPPDPWLTYLPCGEAADLIRRALGLTGPIFPDLPTAFQAALKAVGLSPGDESQTQPEENKIKPGADSTENLKDLRTTDPAGKNRPAVILLSPGCASFDAYESYVKRGEHFISLAQKCLS